VTSIAVQTEKLYPDSVVTIRDPHLMRFALLKTDTIFAILLLYYYFPMRIKTLALLMLVPLFVTACTPPAPAEDTNEAPFSTESPGETNEVVDENGEPLSDEEMQEAEQRNQERSSEAEELANAVEQFTNDGGNITDLGTVPDCEEGVTGIGTIKGLISLNDLVPAYLSELPTDPRSNGANDTGYAVCVTSEGFVISAPNAELGEEITITK